MTTRLSWTPFVLVAVLVCVFNLFSTTHAVEDGGPFRFGSEVPLWVNKVGPFSNPQESYPFYSLYRDCLPPGELEEKNHGWGEIFEGNAIVKSGTSFSFNENEEQVLFCTIEFDTDEKVNQWVDAVARSFWFEVLLDDLPVWGSVGGDFDDVIYSQYEFTIGVNGGEIIFANVSQGAPKPIRKGTSVPIYLSTNWVPTEHLHQDRFHLYLDSNFFEHRVHQFSLINSFMLVVLLVGVVGFLLFRSVRRDLVDHDSSTNRLESGAGGSGKGPSSIFDEEFREFDRSLADDTGWKHGKGDAALPPTRSLFFAGLLGAGIQLATLAPLVMLIAVTADLYEARGSVTYAVIACYIPTALVGGMVSGAYLKRYKPKATVAQWGTSLVVAAGFFPALVLTLLIVTSIIASAYDALAALPFGAFLYLIALWLLVSLPLTTIGTLMGRNLCSGKPADPLMPKPATYPNPTPEKVWYGSRFTLIAVAGLLPFGTIFIELYFVLISFWNYKVYYVYGFALLVFLMMCTVCVCVSIVVTYILLNSRDYRWHWPAFAAGASFSIYVFLYCAYFFLFRTYMHGLLQTVLFFGYAAVACAGLALVGGSVAYFGTVWFVRFMYANVKNE